MTADCGAGAGDAPFDAEAILALDRRARGEALDPRRSLLLQAPAGSGKTTVLTARFLALLSVAESPEEIVAITFTRKAAAEMRQRVLGALQSESAVEAAGPAGPAAAPNGIPAQLLEQARRRDRERGWELTRNPARLRIQTVDALNHWLAQALPVAARTAPALRISDAPTRLYRRAARRCLQGAWADPELRPAAELLFARLDNSWPRLERLTAEMLERRSHWLPRLLRAHGEGLRVRVEQSLEAMIRAELTQVMAALPAPLLREGGALLAHAARARRLAGSPVSEPSAPPLAAAGALGDEREDERPLSADPSGLGRWRALANLALTGDGWRSRFTRTEGFPAEEPEAKRRVVAWVGELSRQPDAAALLRLVRDLPDARLPAADEQALEALALLLRRAAAELQLVFAEHERADHTEIAAAARAALVEQGDPSEFALRAGTTIRHILVDEFQDTSLEQFEMLRALTAGWTAGDGRTLFLVGDPMQSIYQFREAEVGLFLRARERGLGEIRFESLQLRRNFRSRPALIAWINERFARLFPPQDDARLGAIRYLPSVAPAPVPAPSETGRTEPPGGAAPVTLHRFEPSDRDGEARRARADASIAVLVASREHAAAISAVLRGAEVPVRGVDLEPLRDRPVIRDLAALTRALLHGADRTAWLALLRAPWCGLTLARLHTLVERDRGDLIPTLLEHLEREPSSPPAVALARLAAALLPALRGAERTLPLWQRVERCWLRLAGPAVYVREGDRLDARRYLDALAVHDDPESLAGEALTELTEGLYAAAPPAAAAVEIMTIHAAKGLEWDVVILPGLGRSTARDQESLLHWLDLPRTDQDSDLLLCPIREVGLEPRTSLARYIRRFRARRARIERVRLLYVAATRARQALHLLGALPPARRSEHAPRPLHGAPLELLWPAIGADFLALAPAVPPVSAPATELSGAGELLRLPQTWTLPQPPEPPAGQRLRTPPAVAGAPEYRWVGGTARAVGSIVHAELHRLALAAELPTPAQLAARLPDYAGWLAELGVPRAERAGAQARIGRALASTLSDARGRWLLSRSHPEARSEWRLSGLHQGCVVTVVFDRMLLDEHGERWIVDFKTSVHEGAGQEEFIEAECGRYRTQLMRYAALAAELGPQPVRTALYFPLLGVFRELGGRLDGSVSGVP